MSFFFFFKVLSDLSFFFFAASAIFGFGFDGLYLHYFPIFLLALVGAGAMKLSESGEMKRFLPLFLLPLAFLGAEGRFTFLFLAISCAYIIAAVVLKRFSVSYEQQVKFLTVCGFIALILTFIVLPMNDMDSISHLIPFVIIFVSSDMVLTQGLRHSPSVWKQKKYKKATLLCSGSVILISILFSSKAFLSLLGMLIQGIYNFIIKPILLLLMMLIGGIFSLIISLIPAEQLQAFSRRIDQNLRNLIGGGGGFNEFMSTPFDPSNPEHLKYVVIIALIVIVVALTVLLIKRLKKHPVGRQGNFGRERRAAAGAAPDNLSSESAPKDLFPPKEPRAAVRFYYRKFLRTCIHMGMILSDSETSQSVEQIALKSLPPASRPSLASLRQVYIKARYSPHPIEKEDVQTAKETVELLEKQANAPLYNEEKEQEFEKLQKQISDIGNPL